MNDYEQFLALAQSRRSIRKFTSQPITQEDLQLVLEAARWAPSNHNRQPWRFLLLQNKNQIVRLAERIRVDISAKLKTLPPVASGYASEFAHYAVCFSGASALIVALHKRPARFATALLEHLEQPSLVSGEPLSVAMAVQNILLAAHALGLGGCVLTAPLLVPESVGAEIPLPAGYELTCFVALGHPDEEPLQPRRKSIDQIAEFPHCPERQGTE
jgi:nitroreductase